MEVNEENGCVRYVRGSRRKELRPYARTATLEFSQAIVDDPTAEDEPPEVAIPARPGVLLVHYALTIYRTDGNRSRGRWGPLIKERWRGKIKRRSRGIRGYQRGCRNYWKKLVRFRIWHQRTSALASFIFLIINHDDTNI